MDKRYKKPDHQIPIHEGWRFTWVGNTGSADGSDFGKQVFSPLYKDAADIGFYIFSSKTGVYKPFVLVHTEVDSSERDLLHYEFESMDDGGKFIVKIFND